MVADGGAAAENPQLTVDLPAVSSYFLLIAQIQRVGGVLSTIDVHGMVACATLQLPAKGTPGGVP